MKLAVERSVLRGRVAMPGSKSHTIRMVALGSLASGSSAIEAPLVSADTLSAVRAYRALGARIDTSQERMWRVEGTGGRWACPEDVIDVGNSGTTLRLAAGSAALLAEGAAVFTGDEQVRRRPNGPLLGSLNDLGARCRSTRGDGRAPLVVEGRLRGGRTTLEAVSSQYLSALLLSAPLAEQDTTIEVLKLNEKPYVNMTLRYLEEQGIAYQNEDFRQLVVKGGQGYKAFARRTPGDFSSATFFFCAGAILEGELVLEGLDFSDAQGDKAVVEILRAMGAEIVVEGRGVRVRRGELRGVEADLNATPDALPALAVTACFANSPSRFYNVPQARLKETDRIAVMAGELAKLGAEVAEQEDGLMIRPVQLHAAAVQGHGDHRVVMALSLAGMALGGRTVIDTAEAVGVTFPRYVDLMRSVGARMAWVGE